MKSPEVTYQELSSLSERISEYSQKYSAKMAAKNKHVLLHML